MTLDAAIVELLDSGRLLVFGCRVYLRCGCCDYYRPVKSWLDEDGYPKTSLKIKRRTVHLRVHRIVYVAAFGPTLFEIDHTHNDREDFRLCRLHPVTRQENVYRMMARRHGAPECEELPQAVPF